VFIIHPESSPIIQTGRVFISSASPSIHGQQYSDRVQLIRIFKMNLLHEVEINGNTSNELVHPYQVKSSRSQSSEQWSSVSTRQGVEIEGYEVKKKEEFKVYKPLTDIRFGNKCVNNPWCRGLLRSLDWLLSGI
jgi:hypothetical protein